MLSQRRLAVKKLLQGIALVKTLRYFHATRGETLR
jgi:hypothetical protein